MSTAKRVSLSNSKTLREGQRFRGFDLCQSISLLHSKNVRSIALERGCPLSAVVRIVENCCFYPFMAYDVVCLRITCARGAGHLLITIETAPLRVTLAINGGW